MPDAICPECNTELPNGSDHCPECGLPVSNENQVKCPECSKIVEPSAACCPECGFPFETTAEPQQSEIAPAIDTTSSIDPEIDQSIADKEDMASPTVSESLTPLEEDIDIIPAIDPEIDQSTADEEDMALPTVSESSTPAEENVIGRNGQTDGEKTVIALEAQILALNAITENINQIISDHNQANSELLDKFTEQNRVAANSVKELASSVTNEFVVAAGSIKESSAAATTDINNLVKQAKDDIAKFASKISYKSGNTIDYTFMICAGMLLFSLINLFITAYILRIIK